MKVAYRASLEEFSLKQSEFWAAKNVDSLQLAQWVIFSLTTLLAPLILFYLEYFLIGILVFAINLGVVFLNNHLFASNSKNSYSKCFPNLETTDTTIEVNEKGLICEFEGISTFVPWRSIHAIVENRTDITFATTPYCLYVPKRAFDDEHHFQEYLSVAREHQLRSTTA